MTATLSASQMLAVLRRWLVGQPISPDDNRDLSVAIKIPGLAEVWTLTQSAATDGKTYTITLKDENGATITTVSWTAPSSSSTVTNSIAAALVAWNLNGIARQYAYMTVAAGVATFTGTQAGRVFEIAESDSQLSVVNDTDATAAGTAAPGDLLFRSTATGIPAGGVTPEGFVNPGLLADAGASLAARVETWTLVYDAGTIIDFAVVFRGVRYAINPYTMATDLATSRAALVAAINTVMPADTVIAASGSGGVFTLTSEIVGEPFSADFSFDTGNATGTLTVAYTTTGANTDVARYTLGVALRELNTESGSATGTSPVYPSGRARTVRARGSVAVTWQSGDTLAQSLGPVYVGTDSTNLKKLYGSPATLRAMLPFPRNHWNESTTPTDGVGNVHLDLPV